MILCFLKKIRVLLTKKLRQSLGGGLDGGGDLGEEGEEVVVKSRRRRGLRGGRDPGVKGDAAAEGDGDPN